MKTRLLLATVATLLVICAAAHADESATSTLTPSDLQHHRWVLERIDGEPLPALEGKGQVPELDFGDQMTVTGNTGCNRFNGQAVLRDGFFLIESMVSTRMACPSPWGDIERLLQTVLGSESTASIDENRNLILTNAGTILRFRLEDWVRAAKLAADTSDSERARGFHNRGSRTGYTTVPPRFGGRNSPAGEIDEADVEVDPAFRFPAFDDAFDSWIDWKRRQNEQHGIQLSSHYSTLFQNASDSLDGEDKASAAVFRGTLRWTLLGKDTPNHGSLNVMLDYRHGIRDETPAGLGGQVGYIGQTGMLYTDQGFSVINLNWQQAFRGGDTGVILGRYDPNDYMNVLGYVNPWSLFSNLAINLDTSVALPDSSWGIGVGSFIDDQWYMMGGINDANGVGTDDLEFFEGGSEFFTFGHLGWTPSKDERYFKNVHIMAWHVDERRDLGIGSANGMALAANWTFDDKWMPFVRVGFSSGSAPIYNESITLGMIYHFSFRSDMVGLAVNHGSPPDSNLSDQTTTEAFWRIQLSQNVAVTPSVQLLQDPALNPVDDSILVWGVRFRITL